MKEVRPGTRIRDVRVFAAGAGCGLIGGALAVFVMLWQLDMIDAAWTRRAAPPTESASPVVTRDPAPAPPGASRPTEVPATPPAVPPVVNGPSDLPGAPVATPSVPTEGLDDEVAELASRDLQIPVQGITASMLTRQFSDRRSDFRTHEALDIIAPRNTPVHAVEDGTVARLFLSKAGGITVYQFDPSQRFSYYYAHLERYADGLHEGDAVKRGQLLGYVGTSGNAPQDTPHLHFAVFRLNADKRWWEGTPLDPYDVLK